MARQEYRLTGAEIGEKLRLPEAVEKHFGAIHAPLPVELLSDSSSPDIAEDTRRLALQFNLPTSFTLVARPQSSSICAANIKTLKRHGLRVSPIQNAASMLGQNDGWCE